MKFFRALCSQVLNASKDGEQKITGVHVVHKTVIFLGFSILIQGPSKIQCAPRGMLETSLTSKQEQKKEILSDCPCSRTGRKGVRQSQFLDDFNYVCDRRWRNPPKYSQRSKSRCLVLRYKISNPRPKSTKQGTSMPVLHFCN